MLPSCAMFSSDRGHQNILVSKSLTYWTKTTSVFDGHAKKLFRIAVDKMDANRCNFLTMLKLTAKMQHTFHHEANIRPTSLTSLFEELSESHFNGKSMHACGQILGNHE